MRMNIPLSSPDITEMERKAVQEVLKTPILSLGPKLREFEKKIAQYAHRTYAVGVNSGTAALHLAVRALGIGEGDEVITTPFSFIASANCILYERAKPVFVDIDEKTFNIDPSKIEEAITKHTKAILVVDVFGYPAEWKEILRIAKKYHLKVIEDSAEAIGAEYKGSQCGSFGDISIFSFYPNKQITTGEGGALLTDDKEVSELCHSMANQGRKVEGGKWLEHIRLGYNYRLSELQCALGLAQLKRIRGILKKRERVAQWYNSKLAFEHRVQTPFQSPDKKRSWFVYVLTLEKGYTRTQRDRIVRIMGKKGIQCGLYFQPIHLQSLYRKQFGYKKEDFPVAESISERVIALPFFTNIKEKEVDFVVQTLQTALRTL